MDNAKGTIQTWTVRFHPRADVILGGPRGPFNKQESRFYLAPDTNASNAIWFTTSRTCQIACDKLNSGEILTNAQLQAIARGKDQ